MSLISPRRSSAGRTSAERPSRPTPLLQRHCPPPLCHFRLPASFPLDAPIHSSSAFASSRPARRTRSSPNRTTTVIPWSSPLPTRFSSPSYLSCSRLVELSLATLTVLAYCTVFILKHFRICFFSLDVFVVDVGLEAFEVESFLTSNFLSVCYSPLVHLSVHQSVSLSPSKCHTRYHYPSRYAVSPILECWTPVVHIFSRLLAYRSYSTPV